MKKSLNSADADLVDFLTAFYSIGQLQLIYCTLTDQGTIPGMEENERQMRVVAIRQILGIRDPQLAVTAKSTRK